MRAGLVAATMVFVSLAGCVLAPLPIPQDEAVLVWLRGHAGPTLDAVFLVVTRAGYELGVIPAHVLLVLALALSKLRRQALFALLAGGGSLLLNQAIKHLVGRERPALWISIAPETSHSFPSGHAMAAATLATVCVLLAWRAHGRWRWFAAGLAVVSVIAVGVSRLYLGVHWPSDVLAGWLAGVAWVLAAHLLVFARGPNGHEKAGAGPASSRV